MTNTRLGTGQLGPSLLRYTNKRTGTKDRAVHKPHDYAMVIKIEGLKLTQQPRQPGFACAVEIAS
jgi:hypothetical protein